MGFFKVEKKAASKSALRLKTVSRREGRYKLIITIPNHVLAKWFPDNVDQVDAFFGDGKDREKLILVPRKHVGTLKISQLKWCATIRFPELDHVPDEAFEETDPAWRKVFNPTEETPAEGMDPDCVEITLPEWLWNPEHAKSIIAARRAARQAVGK